MKAVKSKLGFFLFAVVVTLICWGTGKILYLKNYGERVDGYIQSIYKSGSKGQYHCRYTYHVGQQAYSSTAAYSKVQIGEKVTIRYIRQYPRISALEKMIDEYY